MLKRFGDSVSPYDTERVAKVGLITAEMKQDQAQLTRLAETAVKEGQNEDSLAYFQLARGMAEFRAAISTQPSNGWIEVAPSARRKNRRMP